MPEQFDERLQPFAPYLDPMVDDLARESRNSTLLLRVSSEANLAVNAEWAEYLTRRALEFDPDNPEAVVKLGRTAIGHQGAARGKQREGRRKAVRVKRARWV